MAKVLIFSIAVALLAALGVVLSASSALAEPDRGSSTEDCLVCHNADPTGPMGNATQLYMAKHDSQVGECLTCHKYENEAIHGMWNDTPEACARCHRTHSAVADDLLVADKDALCLFCHGHDTGLAQTDVLDGILRLNNAPLRGGGFETVRMNTSTNLANSTAPGYPTSYPDEWQYPVGSTSSRNVTSKHTLKEYLPSGVGATTVWGSWNSPGMSSTPNAGDTNAKLECVSCHDPHAYGLTYRMLSRSPAGSGVAIHPQPSDPPYLQRVFVTDQLTYAKLRPNSDILSYTTEDYSNTWLGNKTWDGSQWVVENAPETSYAAPDVLDPVTGNETMVYSLMGTSPMYSQQLTEWCASCHDRYHAAQSDHTAPGGTNSGDAIFAYRHKTGDEKPVWNPATNRYESNSCGYSCHNNTQLNCLGCHVAHGTAAQMTPIIQAEPWPGTGGGQYDTLGNGIPLGHGQLPQDTRPEFTGGHDYDNEIKSNLLRIDNRGVCQNPSCHPKGKSSYLDPYDDETDVCARCHSGGAHSSGSDCTSCHTGSSMACDSCHGAPPATGAHTGHFGGNATLAAYGGTENLSTATDYIFQCGNCHPLSRSSHLNGVVDVELYNASAPAGSLKSMNPSTASYTPGVTTYTDVNGIQYTLGTCSNVYCHSKTDWSSPDPISNPLMGNGTGLPLLDSNSNLMYNPYSVNESRVYASVGWGGSALNCNSCHRNNPQTSYPGVQAGVGNSHGWIDDYGWEDLHAYNMSFAPLICRTCHYNTVTDSMTWTRDSNDITTYGDVAVANKAYHVNGIKDVAFDTVDTIPYGSTTFSLSSTTYNSTSRLCSSVPCHINQPNPEWGKPYRFWNNWECDQCHRIGRWPSYASTGGSMMAPAGGLMAPGGDETTSPTTLSPHAGDAELNCLGCHNGHSTRP